MRDPILKEDVRDDLHRVPLAEELLRAMDESASEGPGQYLREMREALNIPSEEVAAQLNLAIKQVDAIEENEFDVFPAPIYVRSHLRRYSELVGFPGEKVVAAYERMGDGDAPPLRRVSIRRQINSRHSSVRGITYIFAIAMLILLFAWWQTNGFSRFMGNDSTASQLAPPAAQDLQLPVPEPATPDDGAGAVR